MTAASNEYERFLEWLKRKGDEVDPDVRRLASIIFRHFDQVAAVNYYQSRRSALVARLIKNEMATTSDAIALNATAPEPDIPLWTRLTELTLGPFRGFTQKEEFDLNRRIVLFYGPNGTGKSSICEGLEYCLLGTIKEAEARGIESEKYATNLIVKAFERPTLRGLLSSGADMVVTPDLDRFRFVFIEKNRIDDFSRIASRTSTERGELIAALFGVDAFNAFVGEFNDTLDAHLTLATPKKTQLDLKKATLSADQKLVESELGRLREFETAEGSLAESFKSGCSYTDLLGLIGTSEIPGRLAELEGHIGKVVPAEWKLSVESLQKKLTEATVAFDVYEAKRNVLQSRSTDVSFKSLYQAVIDLESISPGYCPACETPMGGERSVLRDPFEKARSGLEQLAELSKLEEELEAAAVLLEDASRTLKSEIDRVIEFARENSNAGAPGITISSSVDLKTRWWAALLEPTELNSSSVWQALSGICKDVERYDESARQAASNRAEMIAERDRLNDFKLKIVERQTLRAAFGTEVIAARRRIGLFDDENKLLIAAVQEEGEAAKRSASYKAAYDSYLALLRRYRDELPKSLIAGLNDLAMELYNDFNRSDSNSDKLAQLRLPLTRNDRILIAFRRKPEELVDALHVLSEGHVRCLGLAILLAKNLSVMCPSIIFDDAVNAIDDDHRSGIRHTLFDNPKFRGKQLIVTCHGEEFIKDIEGMLGATVASQECVSYTFLPHAGDNSINVRHAKSKNYILESQRELNDGNKRNALAAARRAMEGINSRTWKRLEDLGLGEVKIKMRGPKSKPETHEIAIAMKERITSSAFVHAKKEEMSTLYESILKPRTWSCLNAGTHENEDLREFEVETVRDVIEIISGLDEALRTWSK